MTDNPYRDRVIRLMGNVATSPRETPVKLATGETTSVYLDVKNVLVDRWSMQLAAHALWRHIEQFHPTAIGGPTMGADVLTHSIVAYSAWNHTTLQWFSVREPKTTHGLGKAIEGYAIGPGDRVVITDDVASSGKSLAEACARVLDAGADVIAIAPFVDRSGVAEELLRNSGYFGCYTPLMTYEDLGLEPLARKVPARLVNTVEADNWTQGEAAMQLVKEWDEVSANG